MILRNHGIVICGETIEEAFHLAQSAVKACSFQVITFISLYLHCMSCKSLITLSVDWTGNTVLCVDNLEIEVGLTQQQNSTNNSLLKVYYSTSPTWHS